MSNQSESPVDERGNRRYAVSANRSRASHRVRYVETGGAAVDVEECTFCQAMPSLDGAEDECDDESGGKSAAEAVPPEKA
ncbi:hypothetical protein ACFQGA_11515 [Marinobacter koreensis]|uniref:Uncharacterized protein n=1 Tax=Marinobacter koreensis TaxID=335974 RepID=A0ABW0RJY5_9GAMM|nr:hypothetical protein [Marinobacter koreensis]MCK7548484.1 hypothetical protein [Marinobacter koreensis]